MGLMSLILNLAFGNDRNAIRETVELFQANAEQSDVRDLKRAEAALAQFAAEFAKSRPGLFDRLIDGLNRVPRPAMALGTLALFVSAMIDPIWFAARMQGLALVPEPLWWLLGAIVSFYFGARHQAKSQEFQRSIAATLARAPQVREGIGALLALQSGADEPAEAPQDVRKPNSVPDPDPSPRPVSRAAERSGVNAALDEWRRQNERD